MTRCMKMSRTREGLYGYLPASMVEDWEDVKRGADAVRFIETLVGWPGWWAAYEVATAEGAQVYFVQVERRPQLKRTR